MYSLKIPEDVNQLSYKVVRKKKKIKKIGHLFYESCMLVKYELIQ